ncbi:hypothetical protein SSE37_16513 [Sagittula stellata E-37]|uniref:Uncharacterized protein n=1 Tax=Sagittula stellata (strain ATCC 700073 / DSM 11524 / E-37) TaxID=388399 RepID=A3K2M4_SAGS3|nr:hypothetical protein SSE37_16513 [Sagittula stellata E-37]
MLIVLPAMMLPQISPDTTQIVALLALVAAMLTFVEYVSAYPSLIEFRDAPPFNRTRFLALFFLVVLMTLIVRGAEAPTPMTGPLRGIGHDIGVAMDFPFSPVRLMVLAAPTEASEPARDLIRSLAGLSYLISIGTLVIFVALVRLLDWPLRKGAFNFFVNLPLFDPTTGGDVLLRLKRDSHINVALGFLLPFLFPALMKLASLWGFAPDIMKSQHLIWTMVAWSFLPASLIMRGVALMRIADLIEEKRRRAYAQAELQLA